MNLAWWLARSAQRHGERTAIGHGALRWCSYTELTQRAARLAAWLQGQGVEPAIAWACSWPTGPNTW